MNVITMHEALFFFSFFLFPFFLERFYVFSHHHLTKRGYLPST